MAFIEGTKPIRNSIGFHEHSIVLNDATGDIELNFLNSNCHIIYPIADITIGVNRDLKDENLIPDYCLIHNYVLFKPKQNSNIHVYFPNNVVFKNDYHPGILLKPNVDVGLFFFSWDSGLLWNVVIDGVFGPSE